MPLLTPVETAAAASPERETPDRVASERPAPGRPDTPLRVLHLSAGDTSGGAARAALRLHQALRDSGHLSTMRVRNRRSDAEGVEARFGRIDRRMAMWRGQLGLRIAALQQDANPSLHSVNLLPSLWSAAINASDADLVHLHWVGGETLSIADLGRIRKPIVWTLHDMWAFCGAEHLAPLDAQARWRIGYLPDNRPADARGPDIDRWVWNRKRRAWRTPMHIAAPSRWLAECAGSSALMHGWPTTAIPNVLDTGRFSPQERGASRSALGLPTDGLLLMFGAFGTVNDPNKGLDLLRDALQRLAVLPGIAERPIACVILGGHGGANNTTLPFPAFWTGQIDDDARMARYYSAVDLTVVPSRIENLPQMATEAQACGCPVAGFHVAGMPEAVEHEGTGWLARAYDTADLAHGMATVLRDPERRAAMSARAVERARGTWTADRIVPQYLDWYREAIRAATQRKGITR